MINLSLETNDGIKTEYNAAYGEIISDGTYMARIHTDKKMSEVAMEFEQLARATTYDSSIERTTVFCGPAIITSISRHSDGSYVIQLRPTGGSV